MTNAPAIEITDLGKMYKLYRWAPDRVIDAFGLNRLMFWRKTYYQAFWAVRGLDLSVRRGERLGIIGRNGAGKSTLLKIIAGNVSPSEGSVKVNGRIQALLELGTGFHPEFTGRQNIRASLAYQGFSPAQIREKEEEIIDFAELESFIEQPIKTYSAGMHARLAFSTATSIEPDILIIDEVLGAGDAYFAGKCLERMRKLTEKWGATVLFVSHDLGSVQRLCERVVWIDRGQVLKDGSPVEVTKAYYASILEQENLRLRARNARIARGQAKSLVERETAEHVKEVLIRLVVDGSEPPKQRHPVKRIELRDKDGFLAAVEPGTPMDNDTAHAAYILADKAFALWGDPVLLSGQRVRCFENTGGRYGHAPCAFAVPVHLWETGAFTLAIEHAVEPGDNVAVEIFDGQAYLRMGLLTSSSGEWRVEQWPLPHSALAKSDLIEASDPKDHETTNPSPIVQSQKDGDRFYTEYAEFVSIKVRGSTGDNQVFFIPGEPITLAVEVDILAPIPQCGFVLTLYTLTNVVIGNFFWPIPEGLEPGRRAWEVIIENPNLRQNEYLVSCGLIQEHSTISNETTVFFCRWNRALSFRIEEEVVGSFPIGLVRLQSNPPDGSPLEVHRQEII